MEPIITTSRSKAKSTASHARSSSNTSLPGQDRGRGPKSNVKHRSSSAGPTAATVRPPPNAPRPLVLNDFAAADPGEYSPPMFATSDISTCSDGQSNVKSVSGLPHPGKSDKPLITLIFEGRGGTFYCGTNAMQEAIARSAVQAGNLSLRDITNLGKAKPQHETKSDFFLLTPPIGTQDLITCIGLFFLIGKDRFSFAHIYITKNGHVLGALDGVGEDSQKVEQAVLFRLKGIAQEQDWTPEDVAVESIVIANRQAATYPIPVRNALARFLRFKDSTKLGTQTWGAFVVQGGVVTHFLPHMKQIDDFCESGHSNSMPPDVWRYVIDKGWERKYYSFELGE